MSLFDHVDADGEHLAIEEGYLVLVGKRSLVANHHDSQDIGGDSKVVVALPAEPTEVKELIDAILTATECTIDAAPRTDWAVVER
ncbi:hypothetical protein [Kineococcus radiotolerans]|uniref:Uncharacterized protein n=1 Tax=Kineococcus radiotolerans (strain ATCC BAA-149 / DSM 14245 / SRS30216) TaxID=266940 RepID=A6W8T5_KINRD|nr:hypothetical protein [Kineococcus radiotolerans]ABS03224.1 hypothetical protein Krad_1738 [Kineococcus radiotolerans SRS30216 = ATCC BAA-149]